jgi:hypothetical protein
MNKFVIEKCNLYGVQKGVDYEILTVTVMDHEMNFLPYGRFFKKNMWDIVKLKNREKSVEDIVKEQEQSDKAFLIWETRPLRRNQAIFLLKDGMIDFDTAIDCGFGIIRILKGVHKGKYFLYNSENDQRDVPLMLDIYLQIAVKGYYNKSLERFVNTKTGRMHLKLLQHTDDNALFHKLDMAFQREKERDNVIYLSNYK